MATKKKKAAHAGAPVIVNRKARHEFTFLQEVEAGIVLTGTEVKSLRHGKANLQDSYATEKYGEIWLHQLHIAEYGPGTHFNHAPKRPRKLLLQKREIRRLIGQLQQHGMTLVPTKLYFNAKGLVKVNLAVARGKTKIDKRESEKQRDWQRQKQQWLKNDRGD